MARLIAPSGALSTNPLKVSAALGAANAYLGVADAVPLLHGAQGCTAFALVAMVRHYDEPIPLQTTAMNEISTILGGAEQAEEAIDNLRRKAAPALIGIASTALTETRGEDVAGELRAIRNRRSDLAGTAVVYASTPDFIGGLEDGWVQAVSAMLDSLVPPPQRKRARRVNLLCGSHLTPADVEELVGLVRAFALEPIVFPDISTSLDGHVEAEWRGTSRGGTPLADIRRMGESACTLVVGESLTAAAERLEARAGVPYRVFDRLTGLRAVDGFVATLMALAEVGHAPATVQRARSRCVDAMLDAHFHIGGLKVAIGADPDLLFALGSAVVDMGGELVAAASTSWRNPVLARVPIEEVAVADLGELERRAAAGEAELLITHAHGRHAAERLELPLVRAGFPVFDRLGAQDVCRVGYRGTRAFLLEIANAVQARMPPPSPEHVGAAPPAREFDHARP
ncbi:MAG: nitrogenase iron-molybdenum cofactor biosynthesis protein NifN [Alphaproteobacteria bacterium]